MLNLRLVIIVLLMCSACLLHAADQPTTRPATSDITVSASSFEEATYGRFSPDKTLDGDLDSRSSWRAEGHGQWIQYDLGTVRPLDFIQIAFHQGNQRTYTFDIQVSADAQTWTTVHADKVSSGKTTDFETFPLNSTPARYVRIIGKGGSHPTFGEWICITEVKITPAAKPRA